jgi:hypothetical protein
VYHARALAGCEAALGLLTSELMWDAILAS